MALTKVTSGVRTLGTGEVATANMATDPTNASNLSSGSVPTAQLGNVDTSGITANQDDIALLGFKVAANGSLARYNLVDQSIDAFEDATGVDASASTVEERDSSNFYKGMGAVTASGGTVTEDGAYSIHSITATGSTNYITDTAQTIDYLIVAGGGGGGGFVAAGGGAGGYRSFTSQSLAAGTFAAVVGAGAAGGTGGNPGTVGATGSASSFNGSTSAGGGGGGTYNSVNGVAGGSGGGGGGTGGSGGAGNTPSTSPVQGYAGGDGGGTDCRGAGGGGAGAVGTNSTSGNGGVGGVGVSNSITGSAVFYAGGGSGGSDSLVKAGGNGGGGAGGTESGSPALAPVQGTDGLGGGGGGARPRSTASTEPGADGGNGIVIIRRPTLGAEGGDMTLVSNAQTAESAPTNGDLVMTITNGAGTTTPNTDIKAYITRDGSDYTTAVTLVDQGDTGGHTILTANGVDLSGETSGTAMRWKITTHNQSASKTTRIQAVSLGWS